MTYEMQLRGFDRVALESGDTKAGFVELGPDDLWLFDCTMNGVVEEGLFEIMVGCSPEDLCLTTPIEMTDTATLGRPPVDY